MSFFRFALYYKGNEHHLRGNISTFCVKNFVVNNAYLALVIGGILQSLLTPIEGNFSPKFKKPYKSKKRYVSSYRADSERKP